MFWNYIKNHLIMYLPERLSDNPVLVLYDGQKSHIYLGLIDWDKTHKKSSCLSCLQIQFMWAIRKGFITL